MNDYVGYDNLIYLLECKDIASTATTTAYVSLKKANRVAFLVAFGAVTSDSADTEVITVQAVTADDGATEEALAFKYRVSGALGTNTWGAVTTCASTGLAIDPSSDDNKLVWIEIYEEDLMQKDYTAVALRLTDTTDMAACLVSVIGVVSPRYRQTTFGSATASASA